MNVLAPVVDHKLLSGSAFRSHHRVEFHRIHRESEQIGGVGSERVVDATAQAQSANYGHGYDM